MSVLSARSKFGDSFYEELLSSLNYGVCVIDPQGNFIYVNPSYCKLFRYSKEELLGMSIYDVTQSNDIEKAKEVIDNLTQNKSSKYIVEKIYKRKGGSFFLGKAEYLFQNNQEQELIIVGITSENSSEIIHRKKNEKKFENIIELAEEVIFNVDVSGNFTYVNSQAVKLTEFSREELLIKNYIDLILPTYKKKVSNFYSQHFVKKLNQSNFKFPIVTKSKKQVWLDQNLKTIWNEDKTKMLGFTAVSRDVSIEIESEKALLKKKKEIIEKNQILNIIKTLQNEFITGEDLHKQFLSFLDSLVIFTKSTFGFIGEVFYDNGQPYLKTHALTDISWDNESRKIFDQQHKTGIEFRNLNTLFGVTLTTAQVIISNNPSKDVRSGGTPKGHPPLQSYLGIPIMSNDKLIGMFGLANKKGGYSKSIVEKLEPFVSAYSVMIQALRTNAEKNTANLEILEKETLLKEIHHRVKNNMQVISSLLTLTAKKFGPEIQSCLEESKARINTMAIVHEHLYQTKNLKHIALGKYLNSIIAQAKSIYDSTHNIKVTTELDDYLIDTDRAITLGLIINEIISNCYKHAFTNLNEGTIAVSFKKEGAQNILQISDNGNGVKNLEVIEKSTSLGYKLIVNLTKQLKGKLSLTNENGLTYKITF